MKATALSALLLALLASPQPSLGRSIPRGLQKEQRSDEPNGPDVAYWHNVDAASHCITASCRNLELAASLRNPAKRAPPPIKPIPIGRPGGSGGAAGAGAAGAGVGKAGAGVGASGAGVGVGAVRPAPGAAPAGAPASQGPLGPLGQPAPVAAGAAGGAAGGAKRPISSGSEGSQPDTKIPKTGGSPEGAPVAGPSRTNPPAAANPPEGAGPVAPREGITQDIIDRNRGGVFDLKTKGYNSNAINAQGLTPSYQIINSKGHIAALIEVNKPDMMAGVKNLRLSKELARNPDGSVVKNPDGTDKVLSVGDETPQRAKAFETVTHAWEHEAGLPLKQMRGLDFDQVEQKETKDTINSILRAAKEDEVTITRAGNPAEFQQMINTPLGRIGDDIATYTPIGKTVDRFKLTKGPKDSDAGSPGSDLDKHPEPEFQLFFTD
ncbi:hypothetical protein B0T14DRAFT_552849 [Immersiella caudata]|uniref:Uncharacterized protein n=1 Tax=Immersiella caudata TaxID=314043 RepID=A0AA39WVN3_9PEZI|nr:hypothetical protein B0T14DRAFT_552849 [Immersiella caudata]